MITGSATGLGRALAVRLAREGYRLALVDLNETDNRETLRLVEHAGGAGHVETVDVADREAWPTLHDRLRSQWEQLDLLVNNAGVCGGGRVGEFSIDDWDWLLAINLRGVVLGCHTFVDWLKSNPRGAHIVNTASFAAFACLPCMAAYNVSKAGVLALSETLNVELDQTSVRVTVVCPEFFTTSLLETGRFENPDHRRYAERAMQRSDLDVERVADATLRAVQRKEFYVIEGWFARRVWRIKRLFPSYFLKRLAKRYRTWLTPKPKTDVATKP